MKESKSIFSLLLLVLVLTGVIACSAGGKDEDEEPKDTCDEIGLDTKILNGTSCVEGNSPVVSIEVFSIDGGAAVCTGSLIASKYVLTAAHCVALFPVAQIIVTGGPVGPQSQRAEAVNFFVHPGFNVAIDSFIKDDVAVLELEKALTLPTFPIVTSQVLEVGDKLSIYGFGQDDDVQTGFLRSGLTTVNDLSQDNIFTIFEKTTSSVCHGDSGGPAVLSFKDSSGREIDGLVGVTSAGKGEEGEKECTDGQTASFINLQNPEVYQFIKDNAPGVVFK